MSKNLISFNVLLNNMKMKIISMGIVFAIFLFLIGYVYAITFGSGVYFEPSEANVSYRIDTSLEFDSVVVESDHIKLNYMRVHLIPSSDFINVTILNWTSPHKKWNISTYNSSVTVNHTIGNFTINMIIMIKKNGVDWNNYTANSENQISFIYDGGFSGVELEAEETGSGDTSPEVTLVNVTPDSPTTDNNLNCSFKVIDEDNTSLYYNSTWFKNETRNTTWDLTDQTVSNNTLTYISSAPTSSDTSVGDVWKCEITAYDPAQFHALNGSETIQTAGNGGNGNGGGGGNGNGVTNVTDNVTEEEEPMGELPPPEVTPEENVTVTSAESPGIPKLDIVQAMNDIKDFILKYKTYVLISIGVVALAITATIARKRMPKPRKKKKKKKRKKEGKKLEKEIKKLEKEIEKLEE